MTASKIARKKQDNEIFDAKMKKKESERYWRAQDCRPPRNKKAFHPLDHDWITQRLKALPPELLKAIREKGL